MHCERVSIHMPSCNSENDTRMLLDCLWSCTKKMGSFMNHLMRSNEHEHLKSLIGNIIFLVCTILYPICYTTTYFIVFLPFSIAGTVSCAYGFWKKNAFYYVPHLINAAVLACMINEYYFTFGVPFNLYEYAKSYTHPRLVVYPGAILLVLCGSLSCRFFVEMQFYALRKKIEETLHGSSVVSGLLET